MAASESDRAWLLMSCAEQDREELARLREDAAEARRRAEAAFAEREQVLAELRDANERLVIATVHAQDLADEAIAARNAADANEQRFRSLVETSSALVWRASVDGVVHIDRAAWRSFTGLDAEADTAAWLDAVHPDDRARVRDQWTRDVTARTPHVCQYRLRCGEDEYAWVEARAVPIPSTGLVREWIGMLTDISDHVRVEEARERFIGILGHDLRTPLATILMGSRLLGELPGTSGEAVTLITQSAHYMDTLIRDLLDFARGRLGGGIPISPGSCDLRTLCEHVVAAAKQAHPTRSIELVAVGDLRGRWDPDRVEQVLANLLDNAVAHGTGPIVVTCSDDGSTVITTVHNAGLPIPAALLPTLFEPFTRAHVADRRHGDEGMGLGLYIASEIVRAHAGTIFVASTAAEGTTFTIRLPRSAA